MITFDSLTLKAWLEENQEYLKGARIQKIQQPTRRDFVFSIRKGGETKKLYININPQCYHVCFMNKENEAKRLIEIPQKPPMFCMLLRKYLENAVISKVEQPPYERILEFYIETFNELSEKIYLCLAIELMGKHSNVILYSYDTNLIIGCAHNVGAEKSKEREMAGGLPYIYPPGRPKNWYSNENSLSVECDDFNSKIDDYYAECIHNDKFKKIQDTYKQLITRRLKKDENSLKKMMYRLEKEFNADKYRLYGDLIMANLYNLKDYSKFVKVYDYENNKDITIELDETRTLKDNANKFYKLYNKGKTSVEKLTELTDNLRNSINYYEQILYSLEIASSVEDLFEITSEIETEKEKKSVKKSAVEPLELNIDGCKVFVGRNNRQNDYIVSKLSRDEDIWLHTKDCAGSHVLLRCDNPSDELILKCAELAKEYSKGKNSSKVGVIYTKRKYLKKPPAANLGYVTYKNEREIIL
ncbi:fibronectin/fibrinogen-binding protein [Clostridium sp. CAG:967]|nr:fibronectin/fibrinogen-binding protein [Clostridium sp. CAG:967]